MEFAQQSTSSLSSSQSHAPVSSISKTLRTSRPMTANPSQSRNSQFVVDWNNPSKLSSSIDKTNTNNENLQQAFQRFREQRINEIRVEQKVEATKKKKIRRSDPERMRRLRLKFVEQAKRYLGVPYAKKYFQPGTVEYESKLFLDCCGLVRRVMYDLSKEFGFVIGPWNQCYMYDTLPKTITRLSDVQPGDLVFISATYYNPKMKKQRHNLTHVEIMLGEGEKTIGARWNNGTVQYFDSYKFESKSYHSQIYTIKSLDHWLKGICKSYCSEHSWRRRKANTLNKKSIFYPNVEGKTSHHHHHHHHHHHRSHSSKPDKRTSGSSTSSSIHSSNKSSHHRRKRRRRTAHSKSRKHSHTDKLSTDDSIIKLNDESISLSSPLEIQSISDDESVERIANDLTKITCQDNEEQCDDSDSLDDALDAEHLEDENENISFQ